MIIAVLHCMSNASHVRSRRVRVRVAAVAVNSAGAGQQCMHETCVCARYRPISGCRDCRKVNELALSIAISCNRYDP